MKKPKPLSPGPTGFIEKFCAVGTLSSFIFLTEKGEAVAQPEGNGELDKSKKRTFLKKEPERNKMNPMVLCSVFVAAILQGTVSNTTKKLDPGTTTVMPNFIPPLLYRLQCYSCQTRSCHVWNKVTCSYGDVCMAIYRNSAQNENRLVSWSGCKKGQDCKSTQGALGTKRVRCCTRNYCNN
ncbi:hypothetical protein XENTR_v10023657 [Xenopus tropicalis]|nr:hypothetical protein XENTR_v10023657 [Xenopus tropicalis]